MDNHQKYLDTLCFPTLFSTGQYGEFHPHPVKLTFSEYLKSRLMNTDSRFCKSPEFVFYYLWQKELWELSSRIYNVLRSSSRRSHMVKQFVDGICINSSDAGIYRGKPFHHTSICQRYQTILVPSKGDV